MDAGNIAWPSVRLEGVPPATTGSPKLRYADGTPRSSTMLDQEDAAHTPEQPIKGVYFYDRRAVLHGASDNDVMRGGFNLNVVHMWTGSNDLHPTVHLVLPFSLRRMGEPDEDISFSTLGSFRISIFDVLNEIRTMHAPLRHYILEGRNVGEIGSCFR